MNKKTILFLFFVVLCIGVVIVINIFINSPEKESPAVIDVKERQDLITDNRNTQEQAPAPEEEQEPRPEYEATVSNGTILF